MAVLQLKLNNHLFLKDPQSTELGRKIMEYSIKMIDVLGFEAFTFRKLSQEIVSTEASIYRYFENKHRLLVYIITWYWAWIEYRIDFETHNLPDPATKLDKTLRIISEEKTFDRTFPEIDESALQRIVIAESDKTYLTKQVDEDNKEGLFKGYKSVCKKISQLITEINPDFCYPHALVSTVLEAANQQVFFAIHLPSLTDIREKENLYEANYEFLKTIVFNSIRVLKENE